MKPIPILFLSDSPHLPTGMARITKDLAVHVASMPEFRVGCLGRGGVGSSKLPFHQYNFPDIDQWGETHLEEAWDDFAGSDKGVVFSIWDPSRLDWLARPRMGGEMEKFFKSGRFSKWAYLPVDSYGVGGKLTGRVADTLGGFDRRLAYTAFGKEIIEATIGVETEFIPHGYNPAIFQPRDRTACRMLIGVDETTTLVGCVMTNQARKDWGTAFAAIASLKNQIPKLKMWAHSDIIDRHWNMLALIEDFGLQDSVMLTQNGMYSSEQLSYLYSACDITMLPSLGEGWGFPITESLACGVPCIHTNYGGGVEQIPDRSWLVDSPILRLEGPWNNVRPVLDPVAWTNTLASVLREARDQALKEICTNAVTHLQWPNLWPSVWKKWFQAG